MSLVIGYKIRKVREIKNLSQKYMADKLSVSQSHYSDIENCKVGLSEEKLFEIARIMEVDPETIKNFNDQVVFNACSQSGYNNTYHIQNSVEKMETLYTALLKSKEEMIHHLREKIDLLEAEVKRLRK